jgi:MarR family transcriptional regulator, organic hydroperoxide resistance regulator
VTGRTGKESDATGPDDELEDVLSASHEPAPEHGGSALDLEQQVCFGLSIAARGVVAAYRPLLEPLGLTHPQYLVMVSLWQHGAQTVKQLGRLLMLDSGTLSPLLKRLEVMGLVRRSRAGDDERRVLVELTDAGARLRADAEHVHDRVVERLGLSPDELTHLQSVLEQLIDATTSTTGRPLVGDAARPRPA